MALTSVYYDGPVTETQRAQNRAGAPDYGVYGPDDFLVTPHPSIANAVIVKAGRAHGYGVTDTADIDQIVNCTPLNVGQSRWDMIVVRRNWQPSLGGPSTLEALHAGATPTIPAQRKVGPGVEDDQPIAFIKWQGGTSAPVEFIDARVWAANGGAEIRHEAALQYLGKPGAEVRHGKTTWRYSHSANGLWGWVSQKDIQLEVKAASPVAPHIKAGVVTASTDVNGAVAFTFDAPFPNGIYLATANQATAPNIGFIQLQYDESLSNSTRAAFFVRNKDGALIPNLISFRASYIAFGH